MTTGELARATGSDIETIRYYERAGLLPAPSRSTGNYRVYDSSHLERLTFIRRCRGLDIALDEIRALLRFKDDPAANCEGVNDLIDEHITHVTSRIHELRRLERELKALRRLCETTRTASACAIIGELSHSGTRERERPLLTHSHVRGATHEAPARSRSRPDGRKV